MKIISNDPYILFSKSVSLSVLILLTITLKYILFALNNPYFPKYLFVR